MLWIGPTDEQVSILGDQVEVQRADSPVDAVNHLSREKYCGVFLHGSSVDADNSAICLLQGERILGGMPDGVALVNAERTISWANTCLRNWSTVDEVVGQNFFAALGSPELLGPDFSPFESALATGQASGTILRTSELKYFQLHVAPLTNAATDQASLVATLSDITAEILQQQKLAAIHEAGQKLTDLKPDEIFAMDTQSRIDVLKDNIRH